MLVENGTFTSVFSFKNMKACAKQYKKLRSTNNI